ncbi:MAG: SPOR domain-containing protein [Deltaproteobacteria bacterium]|nr:SPOR domain-containing protein [Kofleriaceae bacterium]
MVTRTSEPELYKDKIEVSLDGRQIFYLFFGGAVVACLVFVLGVMVGRRLEARSHVDRAAATSARKDPLAALDRLAEGKGELTYPAALRGADAPVAEVDRALQAVAPRAESQKKPEAKVEAKPEEKKPEAKVDAKVDAKVEAKPQERKPESKVDAKVEAKIDAKPAAKTEDGPVTKPQPASGGKAKFTLQLSAFQDKAEAESFLATVKRAGYGAYVVSAEVDGKTFYRVRLGNYGTYDEAVAAKAEFERKVPKIAYVTRL